MKLRAWLVVLAGAALIVARAAAQEGSAGAAMPDPRQMSGIPLPAADLDAGTVTVRVIKGTLGNDVPALPVELRVGDERRSATTDGNGRATFTGVTIGARVAASVVVSGERITSQEFSVPPTGGTRLMLVAADAGAPAAPADSTAPGRADVATGSVVLGEQTRFVIEFNDDGLAVFNILQIVNAGQTPAQPAQPLVFELPQDARGAAILEGSSPQASLAGTTVRVAGPVAPGGTLVQFAYSLPYSGDRAAIELRLPVPLTRLAVIAQKVGAMQISSPQVSAQREMAAEGQNYLVAQGPGIAAGDALALTLTGLPHAATWPRNVALLLAALILAAGAWAAAGRSRGPVAASPRREELEAERERLFGELTALEQRHNDGRVDPGDYVSRRRELMSALERVYAGLDEDAAA